MKNEYKHKDKYQTCLDSILKIHQPAGLHHWHDDWVDFFDEVLDVTNPKMILETGVFWGASSLLFLSRSNAYLTSFDPVLNEQTDQINYISKIKEVFGDRWDFHREKSENAFNLIKDKKFDLFFIDGDHWYGGLDADYEMAINLNVPYILVDDFCDTVYSKYYMKKMDSFFTIIKRYNRGGVPIVLAKRNI